MKDYNCCSSIYFAQSVTLPVRKKRSSNTGTTCPLQYGSTVIDRLWDVRLGIADGVTYCPPKLPNWGVPTQNKQHKTRLGLTVSTSFNSYFVRTVRLYYIIIVMRKFLSEKRLTRNTQGMIT